MKTLKLIWQNLFYKSKSFFIIVIISCSVYAFSVIPIFIQKQFIDRVESFLTGNSSLALVLFWLFFFYITRSISGGFLIPIGHAKNLYYEYIITKKVRKLQHKINNEIKLEYYESPDMYNLLERSSTALTTGAMSQLMNAISSLMTLIISILSILISLWIIDSNLVLLGFISIIPVFIEFFWFEKKLYIINKEIIELKRMQKQCFNHIFGKEYILESKVAGTAKYYSSKWESYRKKIENKYNTIHRKKIFYGLITSLVKSFSAIGMVIIAIQLLYSNNISIGSFSAIIGFMSMLFGYSNFFIGTLSKSIVNFGELKDISKYFELEREIKEDSPIKDINDIKIENLYYKYPNKDKYAIKNTNLSFKKGEKVAILGVNGSGKTTLISLVAGLYTPTSGRVFYDNKDIKEHDKSNWYEKITVVLQNFQIYSLTLAENVMIGNIVKEIYDEKDIILSLRKANFPYEKWENGIKSIIGKEFGGIELSGGEKQILALARSYYNKNAEVIIIDEPTAALDPKTEEKLYQTIIKKTEGLTTFMVSHRLGSVKIADRILVMDNCEIVEDGTHEELLSRNGLYSQMFYEQAKLYNR